MNVLSKIMGKKEKKNDHIHEIESKGKRISKGPNILGKIVSCEIEDFKCKKCEYIEIKRV